MGQAPQGATGAEGPPAPASCPRCRRDSDHQREVRRLYEEMEQQISREKQQLQAQVGTAGRGVPLPGSSPGWGVGQQSCGERGVQGPTVPGASSILWLSASCCCNLGTLRTLPGLLASAGGLGGGLCGEGRGGGGLVAESAGQG